MIAERTGNNPYPSRPEARSLLASRSLLSQVLETQLSSEGRFGNVVNGEVTGLEKIGNVIGVLSKTTDGHYSISVYDTHGNVNEIPLDPTLKEVLGNKTQGYIVIRNKKLAAIKGYFTNLGYNGPENTTLTQQWLQRTAQIFADGDGEARVEEMRRQPDFFIPAGPWQLSIKQDPNKGKLFELAVGDSKWFIDPRNPTMKARLSSQEVSGLTRQQDQLGANMKLEREQSGFRILDSVGKELMRLAGTEPCTDPANPNYLYFINTGRIYKLDLSGVSAQTARPVAEAQFQINDPKELKIDPYGNFLVVRQADGKLLILDKDAGNVAKSFDNVKGPVLLDEQGYILYVNSENKFVELQTNFQAIPVGGSEAAQKKREEELKAMQERFSSLELKKVQRQKGGGITEEDVANTLREAITRQIDEPLAQTTDPAAIEDIMDRLQGLKADPANQAYGEVVDEFIGKAREKLSGIRTTEFNGQLGEYEKSLEGVQSVGDTIGLDEEFARLLEFRQKTDITDPALRRNIEQRLRAIQTKKDSIVGQYQHELSDAIQQAFPNIEQLIKETGSSQELAMFGTTVEAQQFEMMLANIRDPKIRKELRDRLNAVKTEQRTGLEARGRQLDEEQRLRWAQVVDEAKEDLDSFRSQITELSESKEIDRFERNPLVTAWRTKIFALPPELRIIEEQKLEVILGSRKKDIEHRKELGAIGDTGELKFGQVSFPVYKEPPRIWRPVLLPISGAMYADLAFQDEQGRVWHPNPDGRTPVVPDLSQEQTARMVERYKTQAEEYFKGIKREVPEYSDRWRISEYQMKKLEELAESINIQTSNHMGLTILEGEAGTGKNVLIDVLSNLANREVVTIACNENTAKEDLTYEFYYDPVKGTYKLPSRLIEALKRPGVVILFDEINTVKPGIVKMLNPLFDYRRKLVVNEGGVQQEVVADPTVVLVGTMNPQDYAGVDKLAETILSRADIIEVGYPPFEEMQGGRTRYRSDEAEMLYSYVHVLESLKQREFKLAWDYVVNRDTTNGADRLLQATPNLEKDVRRLYDGIRVANRLREMYQNYQVGASNEPMDFTTSLREMVNIALRMNHAQNVKDVAKRVILPKIGDRRQRVMVDKTIDAVLP